MSLLSFPTECLYEARVMDNHEVLNARDERPMAIDVAAMAEKMVSDIEDCDGVNELVYEEQDLYNLCRELVEKGWKK